MKVKRIGKYSKNSQYGKVKSAQMLSERFFNKGARLKRWVLLLAAAAMLPGVGYAAADLSTQGKQRTYDVARSILNGTSGNASDAGSVAERVSAMYRYFENAGFAYGRFAGDYARNEGFSGMAANRFMVDRECVRCSVDGNAQGSVLNEEKREALQLALANGYLDVFERNIGNDGFVDVDWREAMGLHHRALVDNGLSADFWPLVPAFAAGSEVDNAVAWSGLLRSAGRDEVQMRVSAELYMRMSAVAQRVLNVEAAVARGDMAADDPAVAAAYRSGRAAGQWLGAMGLSGGVLSIGSVASSVNQAFVISVPELGLFWRECRLSQALNKVVSANQGPHVMLLDLNKDGVVDTTSMNSYTYFDHDGNGIAEQTGWIGASDGVLVLDRNGNGAIDGGVELFGSYTLLSSGNAASNGFSALSDLDSNKDKVIDANDPVFADLRVWQDVNLDGVVQQGELKSLAEMGIQSISLNNSARVTTDANGNRHYYYGNFTWQDGSTGRIESVQLSVNKAKAQEREFIAVGDAILALPNVYGMGNVPSLHQAMASDHSGELQAMVTQFVQLASNTDLDTYKDQAQSIALRWTGADAYAQNSRGNYIDGRFVYALEALAGEALSNASNSSQAANMQTAFDALMLHVYGQLMLQTHYADLIGLVKVSFSGADAQSVADLVARLRVMYVQAPQETEQLMQDFGLAIRYGLGDGSANFPLLNALRASGNPYGDKFDVILSLFGGGNLIIGTSGSDNLRGTAELDVMMGREGNDYLYGEAGNDILYGEEGNDYLYGGVGNDTLYGGKEMMI